MRKIKILAVIITLVMLFANIYQIEINNNVMASSGDSGEGSESESNNINLTYVWEQVTNFTNIIYKAYNDTDIPKGRAFGSKGGIYTINKILLPEMENMSLEDVHPEQIQHISNLGNETNNKYYTSIINVTDFQLTVNNPNYQYPNPIPIKECFLITSGETYPNLTENSATYNNNFQNAKIRYLNLKDRWPFGGTLTNNYMNVSSYTYLNDYNYTVGVLSYISTNEQVPQDQVGKVFLFEDEQETEEKLENITNAEGCILINYGTFGISNNTAENTSCSVIRINDTNGFQTKQLLENYTIFADDLCGNLSLTYNITDECFPSSNYFCLLRMPDHVELWNWNEGLLLDLREKIVSKILEFIGLSGNISSGFYRGVWGFLMDTFWKLNKNLNLTNKCQGFILYNLDDYHFMLDGRAYWNKNKEEKQDYRDMALQTFTLNSSVGNFLRENRLSTTLTGYANQKLLEETNETPAIEAYNVIGNITIDKSPNDAIAIISNRYDGWWGQTPGDSGIGGAILLGIAKYMKDYNIKPKYNLTFLFTTGEEYGFRGAWYYNDNHPNDNIKYWMILDQLGMGQEDIPLCIFYNNASYGDIINETKNQTEYTNRTGYNILPLNEKGGGSEQGVANSRDNISTFSILKDYDYRWDRWHTAGENYTKGDCLNNTDRNDVNITTELVWNITKYFFINPDCWFTDLIYEASDSDNDGDSLNDYIKANFTINTIIPNDKVMVKLFYQYSWEGNESSWAEANSEDYIVTSSGLNCSFVYQIPNDYTIGDFSVKLELYNSTGRVNEIIGIDGDNYNITDCSSTYRLYHSLGYAETGVLTQNVEDRVTGVSFIANENASANNITVYLQADFSIPPPKGSCMIYRSNDSTLIGTTEEITVSTGAEPEWKVFTFSSEPLPQIVQGVEYVLVCWADKNCNVYYDNTSFSKGRYYNYTYGSPPLLPLFSNENRLYSIYCAYTPI